MIKKKTSVSPLPFIGALVASSMVSTVLLLSRVGASDSTRYLFLLWNLVLAALAPLIAWWLVVRIQRHGWLHWQQIALTALWISFLPNSFYLITDYIHLRQTYEASLIFDVSMLTSFVLNGLVLGYLSVFMVHRELTSRFRPRESWAMISGLFLACSFAIYLGRYTRWNTWDIVLRPAGLIFDVSDRFANPAAHSQTYETTFVFFVLLLSFYIVIWQATRLLKK